MNNLTNSSDSDSSIMSCADCVDRNACVLSIYLNSHIEHTGAAVANEDVIEIEVIHVGRRIGICTAVK